MADDTIKVIYKLQDEMSKDLKRITSEMEKFNKQADENDDALKNNQKSFQGLGKYINTTTVSVAALTVAAVKLTKAFADTTKETIANANQIKKFSDSTTIATSSISALFTAVQKGGGEIDNVGDIIQDFTEKLGDAKDGSQTYKDAFNRLGVDISGSPQQALEQTIKTLSSMEDKSAALFRGIELFGDSYKLMSNQIAQGNNILEESPLISDDLINSAQEFTMSVAEMRTDLKIAINEGLTPFVGALANMAERLADSQIFKAFTDGLQSTIKLAGDAALALDWMAGGQEEFEIKMMAMDTSAYEAKLADLNKQIGSYNEQLKRNAENQKAAGAGAQYLSNVSAVTGGKLAEAEKQLAMLNEAREEWIAQQDRISLQLKEAQSGGGGGTGGIVKSAADGRTALMEIQAQMLNDAKASWDKRMQLEADAAAARGAKMDEDIQARKDKELQAEQGFTESMQEMYNNRFAMAQDAVNQTSALFDAAFQGRLNSIEAEKRAQIDAVKTSTMSEKKKNEEIAKIEQKAQAESLKIRQNQWRMNVLQSIANTALGVTSASTMQPWPVAVAAMAATAAAGTASTATILANKPKYATGGIVGGSSMVGDQVDARVNSGEMILNKSQQATLFDVANGATTNNNQQTYQITVNALSPDQAAMAVTEALQIAHQNNMIDTSILSVGA